MSKIKNYKCYSDVSILLTLYKEKTVLLITQGFHKILLKSMIKKKEKRKKKELHLFPPELKI